MKKHNSVYTIYYNIYIINKHNTFTYIYIYTYNLHICTYMFYMCTYMYTYKTYDKITLIHKTIQIYI